MAKYLCHTLQRIVEKDHHEDWSSITPGWFSSNITWGERVPKYLYFEAIIVDTGQEYQTSFTPAQPEYY
jgi:hypothetical protein